jgi:cytoskeletal protein CcmA (bactofilin family)
MSTVSPASELSNVGIADTSLADPFDTSSHFSRWLQELQGEIHFAPETSETNEDEDSEMYHAPFLGFNYEVSSEGTLPFADDSIEHSSSSGGIVVITRDAWLEANISVEIAVICGCVIGNITATERVVMEPGSRVTGQIETPALWVQPGAVLDGEWLCTAVAAPAQDEKPVEELPEERQYLAMRAVA